MRTTSALDIYQSIVAQSSPTKCLISPFFCFHHNCFWSAFQDCLLGESHVLDIMHISQVNYFVIGDCAVCPIPVFLSVSTAVNYLHSLKFHVNEAKQSTDLVIEYSTEKHFMLLWILLFFKIGIRMLIEAEALFFRGLLDCHLQILCFKNLEIHLLNVRFHHNGRFISLHPSPCIWSLSTVSSGLIGLVLLLVVHFGSILQGNTPFKKENGTCSCCCSAADIYQTPCHQFLSKCSGCPELMAILVGNILQ